MNRAERIHHDQRIKRKVSNYWTAGDRSPKSIGIVARTRAMCSCMMCGNPRRVEGDKVKYQALRQRGLFDGWI